MSVNVFQTPAWVHDAVFYQIFPERFANGDPTNDPPGTVPWGSKPEFHNFMGGDLQGVLDRLDYLVDLGVTALYLNPIFKAKSNHKFDHQDYLQVDPHFGSNELMKRLVDEAHRRGIRIILDISHNHSGREFFAFADVVKKGAASPYKDWYTFESFPVSGPEKPNYKCWWGLGSLPEFNNHNPGVQEYFWKVTRYWMEEIGIDGWRLDVANEVHHDYWAEWRRLVKGINPDAYIVGEIWGDGTPWLQGDNFDAVMNYVWRDQVAEFFGERSLSVDVFWAGLEKLLGRHPTVVNLAMFNLLGSHDTPRFLTVSKGKVDRLRLAYVFQMTWVGAPVIYYGDEIGMTGGKDPECRKAFEWDTARWNLSLREHVKRLAWIRRGHPVLRSDVVARVPCDSPAPLCYRRGSGADAIYVVLNNTDIAQAVTFLAQEWDGIVEAVDLLSYRIHPVAQRAVSFELPANSAAILRASP